MDGCLLLTFFYALVGVFGVPLVVSISYARRTVGYQDTDQVNHQNAASIPLIVSKCGSYLKRNGKVDGMLFMGWQ
jgi:hypothetical protein